MLKKTLKFQDGDTVAVALEALERGDRIAVNGSPAALAADLRSLFGAVVQMMMSIPRAFSTLSKLISGKIVCSLIPIA